MAELLIRAIDSRHDAPALDRLQTKRGDVIAVRPDGWSWGLEELRRPDWRILTSPGEPVSVFEAYLEADRAPAPPGAARGTAEPARRPVARARRRGLNLDVLAISDQLRRYLDDASRREPSCPTPHGLLDAIGWTKPPLVPDGLGSAP